MRARLVKYSEVTSEKIGCSTSCPKYLYENLENSTHATYGYWTSSVASFGGNLVHCVLNTGFLNYASANSNANSATTSYVAGVRPVIELFK